MSETCCTRLAENTGRKKVAKNCHLGTIAQLCRAISLQLRHVSTIWKKIVKHQYLLHMSSQYGELRPTNGSDRLTSLVHPCKFQLVSHLGSITAQHLVVGVSQTLQHWTEGATYIWQGDHHVGHWPTFLVVTIIRLRCSTMNVDVAYCYRLSSMVCQSVCLSQSWVLELVGV